MLMPKATMNKDSFAAATEENVRLPGQILCMKPVSVTQTVQQLPHNYFRLCILPSNAPHEAASFGGRKNVNHERSFGARIKSALPISISILLIALDALRHCRKFMFGSSCGTMRTGLAICAPSRGTSKTTRMLAYAAQRGVSSRASAPDCAEDRSRPMRFARLRIIAASCVFGMSG
jgi:hypothetical protein